MKLAAIVADTNSGISPALARELGITLVPMPIFLDGVQYFEWESCTPEMFFERLAGGAEVSTSQPAPGDMTRVWEELLEDHEAVLHFPMSSALSGTCQTAKVLAEDYPGKVFVVDNQRISVPQYSAILDAIHLRDRGVPAAEIHATLEQEGRNCSIYIAVNTLALLKKSGRVTAAAAAMASVLNLKPVLQIQGGKLDAFKKARGMVQARQILISAIREDMETRFAGMNIRLMGAYSGLPDTGDAWKKTLQEAFPDRSVEVAPLPLSVCCHTGADAVAVGCSKILP